MEDDTTNELDNDSTRRGRFRVSAPPAGPPETTVGRFRLVPQTGNYGPTSPFLQRGRFSVIPEEPQNSPGGTNITPVIVVTDRQASPDWDFEDEKTVQECPMVVQNGIVFFISDPLFPVGQCASHDLRLDDVVLYRKDVPEQQLTELNL